MAGITTMLPTEDAAWVGEELTRRFGLARWLSTYFGWIPLFKVDGTNPHDPLATPTVFTASLS